VLDDGLMIPTFAISTTSDTSTLKRMCSQGFAHVFCKVILDPFVCCFEKEKCQEGPNNTWPSECSNETFKKARVHTDIEYFVRTLT
jgi:hypothetical protein